MIVRHALAALLLVLAGCGGSDNADSDDNSAASEETESDASSTEPGDDEGEGASSVSTDGPVAAAGYNDCVAIVVAYGQLSGILQGGSTTSLAKVLRELTSRLPAGLQDEIQLVSGEIAAVGDAKLLGAPETETPEFTAAFGRLEDYATSECAASE